MAKPPPSGPHSDIGGVNRDARAGSFTPDPQKNDSADLKQADAQSKAQPDEDGVSDKGGVPGGGDA